MGNTIPPPPLAPSDPGIGDGEPSKERKTIVDHFKRWWKTATTIGSIVVAVGAVVSKLWSFGVEVSELRNTIVSNKTEVARVAREMREARDEYEDERDALVNAIRATRARDQEVITDLRIAVASLQAAQAVRSGRASYDSDGVSFAEAPRSARARAAQATDAEEDARAALDRARRRQEGTGDDDPLAGLDF